MSENVQDYLAFVQEKIDQAHQKENHEDLIFWQEEREQALAKKNYIASIEEELESESKSAFGRQVGGDHYKTMGVQPLEAVYANFGYDGLHASVYTKVLKYLGRKKDSPIQDLKKARHVLDILIEAAEKETDSWVKERPRDVDMPDLPPIP